MRGKILTYDESTTQGLISGDDGQRYAFSLDAVLGGKAYLFSGHDVDFEGDSAHVVPTAKNIYVLATPTLFPKSRIAAAVLAFFLGCFGAHKFYLRQTTQGVIYFLCGTIGWGLLLPGLIVTLFSLIEMVIYLTMSDNEFYETYEIRGRKMF